MTDTFAPPFRNPSLPSLNGSKAQTISHLIFSPPNLDIRDIFEEFTTRAIIGNIDTHVRFNVTA